MLTAAVSEPGPGRLHRVHERVVGAQRTDHGVTLALRSGKALLAAIFRHGLLPSPTPTRRRPRFPRRPSGLSNQLSWTVARPLSYPGRLLSHRT
ncbi:hypothetical protein [Streptomyces lydicus]|uniref:hypothetical protein n=1 Tax=Streptomyces lydicus TaxID=47763 RepID=UPI0013DE179A|nr:hypothetical protein [Streptomyces lydicus]